MMNVFFQLNKMLRNWVIPEVFSSWSDTKAAYRFFDNDRVTPYEILLPHSQRSIHRLMEKETVLIIQDTSFFTYGHRKKTKGLGKIMADFAGIKGVSLRPYGAAFR